MIDGYTFTTRIWLNFRPSAYFEGFWGPKIPQNTEVVEKYMPKSAIFQYFYQSKSKMCYI